MAQALRLAEQGLYTTDPNPRVGCVIVREHKIIGEGYHQVAGDAHAEVHALRAAGEQARGAIVYVTLEPCAHHGRTPPCVDALIAAGVSEVVFAVQDPNPRVAGKGMLALQAAGIQVRWGLMSEQAELLNVGFISRMRRGRPWLRLKLAGSLDGRTALKNGESQWITEEAARTDVHQWRARASAIMTGSGTIMTDDPRLNVRWTAPHQSSPKIIPRVILDSQLRIPTTAKIFQHPGPVWLMSKAGLVARPAFLDDAQTPVEIIQISTNQDRRLHLPDVLNELGRREINELHVECGETLAGALLEAGLVDELIVYLAPCILGRDARAMFGLSIINKLSARITLEFADIRQVGRDLRIIAKPVFLNQ
ncbi:MAG: bifunctional diaminohydroxyphosphoribosylaminopyrimidine deaminase/5-amino-6-(5-phosphoribosylamino)uracil reductase RibD [Gammaproteobacteria bacterium]|nr:bifunctional diaminohydroxyphosphoribosylaminopyrimidine deaminase/5-amino-6-(5-phosphoribosylamino)uracil reductase RibD [Gammaproteobacteria bacterium]